MRWEGGRAVVAAVKRKGGGWAGGGRAGGWEAGGRGADVRLAAGGRAHTITMERSVGKV